MTHHEGCRQDASGVLKRLAARRQQSRRRRGIVPAWPRTSIYARLAGVNTQRIQAALDLDVEIHSIVEPNRLSAIGRRRDAVADD